MGFLNARAILIGLVSVMVFYAVSLPGWMAGRGAYAVGAAKTATAAFPVLGLEGNVSAARTGSWTSLVYMLPQPGRNLWVRFRQRLLDFSDIPLAVALGLGLPILPWRRRAVATVVALLAVFLCHVGLILWTAAMLTARLSDPAIPPENLEATLYWTATRATSYGNVSTIVTLLIVAVSAALLHPRRLVRSLEPAVEEPGPILTSAARPAHPDQVVQPAAGGVPRYNFADDNPSPRGDKPRSR